jgi:hypothetical protein
MIGNQSPGHSVPVTRRQFQLLLLIGAVLLAGTITLVFGPGRGARNDIHQTRQDLNASRRGIFSTLDVGRKTLADANVQLQVAQQALELQKQGLAIASATSTDTRDVRRRTDEALQTVREVLEALGPISELKGQLDSVVRAVEAGVALARTALTVAQQTLDTGVEALTVAKQTLHELQVSRALQQQLLEVARLTLEQAKQINAKIPGVPVFPTVTP